MANYTLHLGFNWDSPLIGTLFGENGASDKGFLQYALADDSNGGNPAWFAFTTEDVVRIQVHALTGGQGFENHGLYIAFGPVVQPEGNQLSTYDPTIIVKSSDGTELPQTTVNGQTVAFLGSGVVGSGGDSPWGTALQTWTFDTDLQFQYTEAPFEMGFSLHVAQSGPARIFVSDPEVIVGSGGGSH